MPSFLKSDWAKGKKATPVPDQGGVIACETFEYSLSAALALADIIEIGILPGNARIVDAIIDTDDLDTGGSPALTLDVGIMSGTVGDADTARTVGTELFAASTIGQAGGMARTTKGQRSTPTPLDRSIGVKVAAAPATGATSGKIRLTVFYVM
jgi:hypothetical protein